MGDTLVALQNLEPVSGPGSAIQNSCIEHNLVKMSVCCWDRSKAARAPSSGVFESPSASEQSHSLTHFLRPSLLAISPTFLCSFAQEENTISLERRGEERRQREGSQEGRDGTNLQSVRSHFGRARGRFCFWRDRLCCASSFVGRQSRPRPWWMEFALDAFWQGVWAALVSEPLDASSRGLLSIPHVPLEWFLFQVSFGVF